MIIYSQTWYNIKKMGYEFIWMDGVWNKLLNIFLANYLQI